MSTEKLFRERDGLEKKGHFEGAREFVSREHVCACHTHYSFRQVRGILRIIQSLLQLRFQSATMITVSLSTNQPQASVCAYVRVYICECVGARRSTVELIILLEIGELCLEFVQLFLLLARAFVNCVFIFVCITFRNRIRRTASYILRYVLAHTAVESAERSRRRW